MVRYVRCMHLRRAVTAQRAIEVIEERISATQQPLNAAADNADLKRHLYLNWVADTLAYLLGVIVGREADESAGAGRVAVPGRVPGHRR